jgi:C4-dicarboxylate-specific signal transduction histidine kinase
MTGTSANPAAEADRAPVRQRAGVRRFEKHLAVAYGTALLSVGLALACSLLLQPFFPYPFLFLFFAAVMAAGWFGGAGPGMFSVVLSTLAIAYYFAPPLHSFAVNATDASYFGSFVLCALAASWVSSSKKRDAEALREARDFLEVRVEERTAELANSVAERERAQQALIRAQSELAHLSQVLTMGELTSSIAHEVNQPLAAVVNYGNACLEWLSANPPKLQEARIAAETIVKDGTRASAVLGRIRALFRKQPLSTEWLDINPVIQELIALLHHDITKRRVLLQADLAAGEIVIRSRRQGDAAITVSVEDNGCGLDPSVAEKIFDPFFTTKPHGTGLGLSISRSLVESHCGRLWAETRPGGGALFQFTLPVESHT